MHEMIENLYELCETIEREIAESNDKIRSAGGKLSGADVEYIDKLTHTLKSIKSVMAMVEEEDGYSMQGGGGMGGGSNARGGRGGGSNRGGSNRGSYEGGGSNRGSYEGSYARGRGRNARRDSMGRYSSERGYSRAADEIVDQLEDMADSAPDERTRKEIKKLIEKMSDE